MRGISQFTKNNAALAGLFLLLSVSHSLAACAPDRVLLRGDWGQIEFRVEVADTNETRNLGLMHREVLPRRSGMLFIYERPTRASFWMRNTLIPLDMLFIDPDGRIAHIHENAIPLDETAIPGGDGRLAVLEINGGLSAQLGIDVGSVVQHPQMPQDIAIWPCEGG